MEVTVAKTAGFCFGVKRAVEKVYDQIGRTEKRIYTYGPIIHNEQVVGDLREKGVEVIDSLEELKTIRNAVVVIRSHGVGKNVYEILKENDVEIVDATCPYVKKIHRIVEKQSAEGRKVLIIGSEDHPEVQGIKGWGDERTVVIEDMDDFLKLQLPENEKLCIVSQTTFNYKKFQDIVEKISKTRYDITVLNTICNATQERQVEAMRIASQVDVMLVIGGKHSSNTQKLYDICRKECKNTYYIQTLGDFNPECISSVRSAWWPRPGRQPKQYYRGEFILNVRVKF